MIEYKNYSGNNVQIALIDSGVVTDHPDFQDCEIKNYFIDDSLKISESTNCIDFGHGTACAWLIHKIAPNAKIISLQCLNNNGQSTDSKILFAIKWCIHNKIDIINLSLGAISTKYENDFIQLGLEAVQRNIFIIAACHDSGYISIPARLPNYIPVQGKSIKGKYKYGYCNDRFIAHGGRQRVAWNTLPYIIGEGSSFATARMSGIVSLFKEAFPYDNYNTLLSKIKDNASNDDNIKISPIYVDHIASNNDDLFDIGNSLVYSFTKEIHHLLLSSDLTNIHITSIVDLPLKPTIGQSTSQLIGAKNDIKISNNIALELESCNADIDTVIISRTHEYERILGKDVLKKALEEAIGHNKNIYSIEYIDCNTYPNVYNYAKQNGIKIRHPMLTNDNLYRASLYRDLYGHIGTKTPVLGIFGTGPSQGKFTTQLCLRRIFQNHGYRVNNFGTETFSELFGFEGFYPLEMAQSIRFDESSMIEFIQGDIRRIEIENKPDIIIVGAQSGVIPSSYAVNSKEYTLPTISFLMATIPHFYILTVNEFDSIDFIERTIKVLEGIGKGKVIAFSVNKKTKQIYNTNTVIESELTENQYNLYRKNLEEHFRIPTYDMFIQNDQAELYSLIVKYFS